MALISDPLIGLEQAIVGWLSSETILAGYNWQRWESDAPVEQPRGHVTVSATGDWDLGMQGPILLRAEIILEAKPLQVGTQAEIVAIMLAMLSGREVIGRINAQITDGSMLVIGPGENPTIAQTIERDLRVRRFFVTFPVIWGVNYV